MPYHKRKNIRLYGYDYGQAGGYFVTICTSNRECLLSRVLPGNQFVRADVQLTELGRIADRVIHEVSDRTGICLSEYVIMPNHIHMILLISMGETGYTVGEYVGMFKSLTLYHWRDICNRENRRMGTVWQRNYYEHILRNEADYIEKLRYIEENPDAWCEDELYKE